VTRSASFGGVAHTVLLATGDPDTVAAEVAGSGLHPLHVSVHAADPAGRDAAVAALRARGVTGPVDALVQPPAGAACAAVLWAVDRPVTEPAPGVGRLDLDGGTLYRLGHLGPPAAPDFVAPFAELADRLAGLGLGLGHLWKTWSYLPVPPERDDGGAEFVRFNLHRTEVFADTAFRLEPPGPGAPAYPANTGVADLAGAATLTGIAGVVGGGLRALAVENARQHPPGRYGAGTGRPRPAQFSRAVLLAAADRGLVLLAGTAAVVGSRTEGADALGQLDTTLGIVDGLLSDGARAAGGRRVSGGLDSLLYLVVYVARAADLEPVRARVAQRVPVPALVVRAPLTRADLLVEVDGLGMVTLHD
jgi:hypothetical protein